jgi:hypothetical protein
MPKRAAEQDGLLPAFDVVVQSIEDGLRFARIACVQTLGYADVRLDETKMEQLITEGAPALAEKLMLLRKAYGVWIDFHRNVEKPGSPGRLASGQAAEQATAHTNLESARSAFLAELEQTKGAHSAAAESRLQDTQRALEGDGYAIGSGAFEIRTPERGARFLPCRRGRFEPLSRSSRIRRRF